MMRDRTDNRSGWGHGTFDPLLVALRRDASDAIVTERLENLTRKGISTAAIIDKVRLTNGPRGAARIQQLSGDGSMVIPRSAPPKAPYRPSRTRRIRRRLAHLTEDLEQAFSGLSRGLGAVLGRRTRTRRRVAAGRGTAPRPRPPR